MRRPGPLPRPSLAAPQLWLLTRLGKPITHRGDLGLAEQALNLNGKVIDHFGELLASGLADAFIKVINKQKRSFGAGEVFADCSETLVPSYEIANLRRVRRKAAKG